MYRIVLQLTPATPTRPATFQYLTDAGTTPWETADSKEALARYEAELDNYKRSVITLIHTVDVDLNPTVEDCGCPDDCICKKDPVEGPTTPTDPENPGTEEPTPENPGENPGTEPTE